MDNQFNNQQNNGYQQGNPYQQNNGYQQGNPYQQNNGYQQGNFYQQGNGYQQGNPYQQGNVNMNNGYGNYGGNAEPQKAPNIFQQFALAFVPTKYNRLTKVKTGSMIGFVTVLVLVAALLSFGFLAIEFASVDMEELGEELPDFTLANGRFYIEEDFMYDEGSVFVYMTEDIDSFSYEDTAEIADEGYRDIILIGRDGISLMQDGQYQQADFSDLDFGMEIDRDWIVSTLMPLVILVLIMAYIFIFVGMGLGYFLFAAVYLLFAMFISFIMKKNLGTGELFRVAVYSKVLMFVVATVLDLLPFGPVSVPFFLRVVITIGFMAFAIAKLPDNRPIFTAPVMPGQGGQGWQ